MGLVCLLCVGRGVEEGREREGRRGKREKGRGRRETDGPLVLVWFCELEVLWGAHCCHFVGGIDGWEGLVWVMSMG